MAVALVVIVTMGIARGEGTNNPTPSSQPPALMVATNKPAEPAKPPGPSPRIQFEKTVYDFGSTSLVESLTGTFTFHNTGTGELKIGKLLQKASVKPDVLKPGEKGELVFKLSIGAAHGALEKHITVTSNDPQAPKTSLSIKVEVKQVLEISPQNIHLGNVRQGTITNVMVLVHRVDGKSLNITKAESGSKLLRTRVEPVEGSNDESAKVIIELQNEGTPRQFGESVKLSLEDVPQPVAAITIDGRLLGDVLVDPVMLYWPIRDTSSTNSEALPTREIKVLALTAGQPLDITNLTTNVKDLSLKLVAKNAGQTYVVVARLVKMPEKSVQGAIVFETNMTSQPKVVIPVTISIPKQLP